MTNCICCIKLMLCIWEYSFCEQVMSLSLELCHLKGKDLVNSKL